MAKQKQTKAVPVRAKNTGLILQDPRAFKVALDNQKKSRDLLKKYIKGQLIEGIDYGRIHIAKNCQFPPDMRAEKCPESHFSKPCLFKPGAEKFVSLLQLRPEWVNDRESLDLCPDSVKAEGVFFLICRLVNRKSGDVIAEGRGACSLKEKHGQINTALKIAKKRALVDAVLSVGLSDSFTQDIDDPEPVNGNNGAEINTDVVVLDPEGDRLKKEIAEKWKIIGSAGHKATAAQEKKIKSAAKMKVQELRDFSAALDKLYSNVLIKKIGKLFADLGYTDKENQGSYIFGVFQKDKVQDLNLLERMKLRAILEDEVAKTGGGAK